ncbi:MULTISPECIES: tetraacyldisaccharide 4'-kinase [Halomonadaceae]|uniref:tetraacyldisaccharide 4'-kinase n=1 Tax=Halomonadaceae TaxID=28256 RepID=UPI00159839DD|nr:MULTISPECIES: tetraacyldisaccharide 4'-kinase [Halomonas]QJQ96390.1 tetraacyldisaccharide 4'-kinase [Halomonas sp. PA5]
MSLGQHMLRAWYDDAAWLAALRPLEMIYRGAMRRREVAYASGRKPVWRAPVPVIVVGNITLGGTGKSPLVAWLGRYLSEHGWRPGLLSRGYGGSSEGYPLQVTRDTPVTQCGDEALMLVGQTGLPMVVDPDRPRGARALVEAGCDILISDDGLQHLALARDLELVVVDGARGVGNGRCLPAGPLREPIDRLARVDAVIVNGTPHRPLPVAGHTMHLEPSRWRRVMDDTPSSLTPLPFTAPVHALAGIGHPVRFFATLESLGIDYTPHPFADHHAFGADDLRFSDSRPIVMTAKDAVKCQAFADSRCWALDVEACPAPAFVAWFAQRVEALSARTP